MSNVIVFVDALACRAEVAAMCERANAEAMRRVFGAAYDEARRFTLRLQMSGRVCLYAGMRAPFLFASVSAALAYVGAMHAVGEYVGSDGISGQYRIEK